MDSCVTGREYKSVNPLSIRQRQHNAVKLGGTTNAFVPKKRSFFILRSGYERKISIPMAKEQLNICGMQLPCLSGKKILRGQVAGLDSQ
jgi:hypothetical protein